MRNFQRRNTWFLAAALIGAVAVLALPIIGRTADDPNAQKGNQGHGHRQQTSAAGKSIAEQLQELRAKVAKLEAALQKNHTGKTHASPGSHAGKGRGHGQSGSHGLSSHGKSAAQGTASGHGQKSAGKQGHGMSKMKGKMRMGKKMGQKMGRKSMSGGKMSGMGKMKDGMGMMRGGMEMSKGGMSMMGRMKGMGQMTMPSALPGFPGASHIYHIGATSFFLDHPQHITLKPDQKTSLNKIKESALLKQATVGRRIEDAEQELWVLTSADKPDAGKIEAKIREIAKLGGDKRIAFIRAVGQAANVLTDEQRKSLVGTLPAGHKAAAARDRTKSSASGKSGD